MTNKYHSSGLQYQAKRNDLYVITYPKCGTTLTQHTAFLVLNDGVPLSADQRLDIVWPHLEEVGGDFVEEKGTVLDGYKVRLFASEGNRRLS